MSSCRGVTTSTRRSVELHGVNRKLKRWVVAFEHAVRVTWSAPSRRVCKRTSGDRLLDPRLGNGNVRQDVKNNSAGTGKIPVRKGPDQKDIQLRGTRRRSMQGPATLPVTSEA